MNTKKIEEILFSDPKTKTVFEGVFPSDRFPKYNDKFPKAFIFNTDPHDKPGEHWVACFQESWFSPIEYFDSYGLPPIIDTIYDFISTKSNVLIYSSNTLQCLISNVCGQYAIFFIMLRCCRMSYINILRCFTNNCKANDLKILRFVKRYCKFKKIDNYIPSDCDQCALNMFHVIRHWK